MVLEVLDGSQRSRLADVSTATNHSDGRTNEDEEEEESGGGEAELAYLTHEGLFISDALNEAEQRSNAAAHAQTRTQTHTDACGSDSASANHRIFLQQGTQLQHYLLPAHRGRCCDVSYTA